MNLKINKANNLIVKQVFIEFKATEINMNLSKERANAVITYLVGKGIASDRLTAKGYGESKPEVPNTNDENRAINRRVEFRIL